MSETGTDNKERLAQKPTDARVEAEIVEDDFQKQPADEAIEEGEHLDREALAGQLSPVQFQPSNLNVAGMSEEEQNMDLTPAVVGPPAYGSPDPTTTAGKLVPVEDHPLADDISEDFGADVEGQTVAPGETGPVRSDLERDTAGEGVKAPQDYEEQSATQLRDLAKQRGITGYSGLNKDDLIALHEEYDQDPESVTGGTDEDDETR